MEWYKLWPKLIQISLQLLALTAVVLSQPEFHVEPAGKTVLENDNVTLYCVFDNELPQNLEVVWFKGGIPISRDNVIEMQNSPRLRIAMNRGMGEYNLIISRVTLGDDAVYYCQARDSITEVSVLESNHVRLEVHHVPPRKYPSCFPLTKDIFEEGEEITITCQSERANPPVTLTWVHDGDGLRIHPDDSQIGYRSIDYTFTVRRENHGDIFQCKLTTGATNSVHRSCSLGPLNVMYRPADVDIAGVPDFITADQEIELECISQANPSPQYSWIFSENFDQTRITYLEDGKRIAFTATLADDGLIIACDATNSLGTERAAVTLSINPAQTNPVYGTTPSRTVTHEDDTSEDKPTKPQTDASSSNDITLKPEVLAIIASTLTLILLVLIILVIITCRCRTQNPKSVTQMPQMIYGQYGPTSIQGWEQGSIYFEPRDRISVRDFPTWQRPAPWHRNVAVQVPWVEEPPYEEIGQNWDEGMTLEI